jgi:hypothetical protein
MRARPGKPAALDDQVLVADGPVLKPAFQDLAGARGVACLRRQRRAGDMRGHAVVRHAAPRVIPGRRLGEPYVSGVSGELAAFQRPDDGVTVADLAAGGVDDVGAAPHGRDQLVVEQALGSGVERRVDRHHVAVRHHRRSALVERDAKLTLGLFWQPVQVGVAQLHIEWLEPPEHRQADPPGRHRPDRHAFQVVGPLHAVGNVPAALDHPLVGGKVVPDQREDHHHHVLGHADAVGVSDLRDGQASFAGRLQVVMVRPDPGGNNEPEVFRLSNPLPGQVRRPERLGDHDVCVGEFPLEDRVRAVLV